MPLRPITSEPQKLLYLLAPAARGSRSYEHARLAKADEPDQAAQEAVVSLSATTLSTTRRLIRRKSPVFGGISTSAMRAITR